MLELLCTSKIHLVKDVAEIGKRSTLDLYRDLFNCIKIRHCIARPFHCGKVCSMHYLFREAAESYIVTGIGKFQLRT